MVILILNRSAYFLQFSRRLHTTVWLLTVLEEKGRECFQVFAYHFPFCGKKDERVLSKKLLTNMNQLLLFSYSYPIPTYFGLTWTKSDTYTCVHLADVTERFGFKFLFSVSNYHNLSWAAREGVRV